MIALAGQAIRTLAMIEAKDNFSHLIVEKKQPSHSLVTTGIYKYHHLCSLLNWNYA
jgi:protein-S-isoprenylcysteine O-methyltransferase